MGNYSNISTSDLEKLHDKLVAKMNVQEEKNRKLYRQMHTEDDPYELILKKWRDGNRKMTDMMTQASEISIEMGTRNVSFQKDTSVDQETITDNLHNINSGRELKDWLSENDLIMKLSEKQCELIVNILAQNKFSIAAKNDISKKNTLFRIYKDENGSHIKMEPTTIDELIDMASDISYKTMSDFEKRLNDTPYSQIDSYINNLSGLVRFSKDYKLLLDAFKQTKYFKDSMNLVNECMDLCQEQPKIENTKKKGKTR